MSTDRMVNPENWIQGGNSVKGNKEEGRVLNTYLNNLQTNVYKAINTFELSEKEVTLKTLKGILKVKISQSMHSSDSSNAAISKWNLLLEWILLLAIIKGMWLPRVRSKRF